MTDNRKFSHEDYARLVTDTVEEIKRLSTVKGGEYAGDVDRLANFRRNGNAMGLPMEAIWGTYAAKHWDAIMQFVQDINTGKSRPRSESITGRADDLIVYLILFKAIVAERESILRKPSEHATDARVYVNAAQVEPWKNPPELQLGAISVKGVLLDGCALIEIAVGTGLLQTWTIDKTTWEANLPAPFPVFRVADLLDYPEHPAPRWFKPSAPGAPLCPAHEHGL